MRRWLEMWRYFRQWLAQRTEFDCDCSMSVTDPIHLDWSRMWEQIFETVEADADE